MIRYEGSIWRPPSEARSLILQATIGCSHNACTYCVSYKDRQYRVRGADGIAADLAMLDKQAKERVRRVFLADGNALAMDTPEILGTLSVLEHELPNLERVGIYGYAKDVRNKSTDDLRDIGSAGLGIVYLGLETGNDELLRWSRKGITSKENIEACKKIRAAGIPLSLTIILGLGGIEHSETHASKTAEALNAIDPEFVGALTLMIPPGTPLFEMTKRGEFCPMSPEESLEELRLLIEQLELSECVFRTNHASNYLPLAGTLNRDQRKLLDLLESVLGSKDQTPLRPEYLRGL
ncbi:MAG: radical SAM protein [Candidatus Thorarchaeota archaeon]|nr:MAG: radical SAM protein [Candidatus Thorarchaeota archaeon]